MATIYQVAARAGVSPATVSRVFNGITVGPGYAEAVRAAAAELHFVPNRTARRLRRQSSEVIALIIPDIENPFFTALARGVEDCAQAAGFCVVLCNSDEQSAKENAYLDVAIAEHMAGVILAPATAKPRLDAVLAKGIPVVAVDRSARNHRVDAVLADNRAGATAATELLYAKGFRRVGCITGPSGTQTADLRAAGWRAVFARRHPRADPDRYLRHADYRVPGGRAAMTALLTARTPPDAVVVANNLMTVGAVQELRERGLAPPGFGVASLGDLPYAALGHAGVEVVPLPARALGTRAAELLLGRIAGSTERARTVIVGADTDAATPLTAEIGF